MPLSALGAALDAYATEGDAAAPLALDGAWTWMRSHAPFIDSVMYPSVVALASYHAICWAFTLRDWARGREGVAHTLRTCAWPQFKWHMIVNTASWLLMLRVLGDEAMTATLPDRAPSLVRFAFELVGCYLVGDCLMYWEHVVMHKSAWCAYASPCNCRRCPLPCRD